MDKNPAFVNIDVNPMVKPDIVADLSSFPWGFGDDSIEEVYALDVIEHMDCFLPFMNECHRILRKGGKLVVRCPFYNSPSLWVDPTHKRGYSRECFSYLEPGTPMSKMYRYSSRFWEVKAFKTDGDNMEIEMVPIK